MPIIKDYLIFYRSPAQIFFIWCPKLNWCGLITLLKTKVPKRGSWYRFIVNWVEKLYILHSPGTCVICMVNWHQKLTFKQSHINTSNFLTVNHIFNKYENIDWGQFSQYPQSLGSCKIYNFWEKLPWPFHQVVWCLRWWRRQFDLLVYTLNNRFSNHLSYYLTMIDLELFILHNLMKWVCISTAYNTQWGLK